MGFVFQYLNNTEIQLWGGILVISKSDILGQCEQKENYIRDRDIKIKKIKYFLHTLQIKIIWVIIKLEVIFNVL